MDLRRNLHHCIRILTVVALLTGLSKSGECLWRASTANGIIDTGYTTPVLTATTSYWVPLVTTRPPPCATSFIHIHDVQGSGETSPLNNQIVTVRGVVIGDYEGPPPALRGFYIQDRKSVV